MQSNKKNNSSGFTLVELMVSIGIIAIISTMALANFKGHNNKNKVDLAAYKLASDIRRAQSFALSMKEDGGFVPDGGWGISFTKDNNFCTMFGDSGSGGANKLHFLDGTDTGNTVIYLENGVTISQLLGSGGDPQSNGTKDTSAIVFESPDSRGFITRQNESRDSAKELEITLTNGSDTKKVKVNIFGLIDVD